MEGVIPPTAGVEYTAIGEAYAPYCGKLELYYQIEELNSHWYLSHIFVPLDVVEDDNTFFEIYFLPINEYNLDLRHIQTNSVCFYC